MIVELSTTLDCPPEKAWEEVRKSRLLEYVASPILAFDPIEPSELPEVWSEGRYLVKLRLFGWVPLGRQWIVITAHSSFSEGEGTIYQIRDNGSGDMASTWDHRVFITSTSDGMTRYIDRVEVQAGLLTPFVWLYAYFFYWHRQRRWRALVKNGFSYR